MGRAKESLMKSCELGFGSIGEKFVCYNCFGDEKIKDFIKIRSHELHCNYCNKESTEECISLDVDVVLEFIVGALRIDGWGTSDERLVYDSEEGVYKQQTTFLSQFLSVPL